MSFMFYKSKYNHPLEFNTSNVLNMEYIFYQSKFFDDYGFDFEKIKIWIININCNIDNAFNYDGNVDEYSINDIIEILNNYNTVMFNVLK